jgi:hypothetical protein
MKKGVIVSSLWVLIDGVRLLPHLPFFLQRKPYGYMPSSERYRAVFFVELIDVSVPPELEIMQERFSSKELWEREV